MLVLVVGPSGAGKDTLINAAKAALAGDDRFVFPRRVVTRTAIAALEDHESVTPEEFALQAANGAYALSWEAHGLCYGLPASIRDDIGAGRVVVMNGSRAMVGAARDAFPGMAVVVIEATPQVRAQRLAGRGRETAAEIAGRLAREVPADIPDAISVDNSGAVDDGISRFLAILRAFPGN
ncbi:MAG: phosphonate metabolism protein/1,5-bisphosphokinase (PRPP-forming) PhnN [Devosia sp.]|uniref:phosphonate metabolism protein/1,5-bisphosphokinase (PRPP-forming) PhnN n=1 Tax=Devosia sp. TaxID=1871048 RepID=UPI001A6489F1|nr:phosphonate metabolism protein/1,5-bisphosphokinase (PRPP-forming) PhnN [Devosia sp.]MBL8598479.1 phosphonate metabolism protein/1,5-bisphosphokinase (PRPP-forming) PhnN [Devosia sp.]